MKDILCVPPPMPWLGFWERLFGVREDTTCQGDQFVQTAMQRAEAEDWAGAMKALAAALAREPRSPYIHCLIGDCYHSAGYDNLAKPFYDETIRLSGRWKYNGNVESAMYSLACILHKEGQVEAAIFLYNKLLAKSPSGLCKKKVSARLRAIAQGTDHT